MAEYNREKIKANLKIKYKKKFKPDVLEKHIEGLVDEFIEIREFVKKNKGSNLPTKEEVTGWFEQKPTEEEIEQYAKEEVSVAKIDVYKIYKGDKLAKEIFKHFYNHKWDPTKEYN